MRPAFDPIDHVLALDLNDRGVARLVAPGAALAAARALLGARRVLLTTGFTLDGAGETDGPPGTAVLGRALRRSGARVHYVTDGPNVDLLAAALRALGEPADVEAYDGAARGLLARFRPTHLVAIERPGRNAAGDYLSARGRSVRADNAPIDALFLERSRAVTVGVGDGGNEVGMGNVRARLVRGGGLVARGASVVRVDHLVVAGTSNWGAYGITAALARLSGRPLLHTGALERRLVRACVAAGAVDGLTRRREATVDALPLDVDVAVVELLGAAARLPAAPAGSAPRRGPASGMMGRRGRGPGARRPR